ncbi:HPr family phosphocarrier protein [candidate division KSB1 bacterium]|nr:HPr family phosphocarrier protein [candidate division KSB1 bacterium]
MKEVKVKIQNKLGLHARPAAEFVKCASQYKSDVMVAKNDREVNGKSIMGVMTLAAEMGSVLRIVADGEDEELAVKALVELINLKFNEE